MPPPAAIPRPLTIFFNAYVPPPPADPAPALSIIHEQLAALRDSPTWPLVSAIKMVSIGAPLHLQCERCEAVCSSVEAGASRV